jgi:hypothetical protein
MGTLAFILLLSLGGQECFKGNALLYDELYATKRMTGLYKAPTELSTPVIKQLSANQLLLLQYTNTHREADKTNAKPMVRNKMVKVKYERLGVYGWVPMKDIRSLTRNGDKEILEEAILSGWKTVKGFMAELYTPHEVQERNQYDIVYDLSTNSGYVIQLVRIYYHRFSPIAFEDLISAMTQIMWYRGAEGPEFLEKLKECPTVLKELPDEAEVPN